MYFVPDCYQYEHFSFDDECGSVDISGALEGRIILENREHFQTRIEDEFSAQKRFRQGERHLDYSFHPPAGETTRFG